jgi:hypothetical protein
MVLITVEEFQEEAALPTRDVDLTGISDSSLQKKINWATAYIQNGSKIDFTNEDPTSDLYLEAADICMELVFNKLKSSENGGDVKQLKEGDVTLTYDEETSTTTMKGIDKRIAALKEPSGLILAMASR